jgi:hypothetical protein
LLLLLCTPPVGEASPVPSLLGPTDLNSAGADDEQSAAQLGLAVAAAAAAAAVSAQVP